VTQTSAAARTPAVSTFAELSAMLESAYQRIDSERERQCWIHVRPKEEVLIQLRSLCRDAASGIALPLLGVPFSVKDNIDVQGMPTTAACPEFGYVPQQSAQCVERLVAAGAVCLGKVNLDQFATGLSGVRSPYGACASVADARYISGGSSSGSAVTVAAGHVAFSLGTDTGGSGRIPAGFNGIIGIKPTLGRVSSRGLVPNCPTLDCVSIFCNSIADGRQILAIIEGYDETDPYSRPQPTEAAPLPKRFCFGRLSRAELKSFGVGECDDLYEKACERLARLGGKACEIDFTPFAEAGEMLFSGPWIAERYSAVSKLIDIDKGGLLDVTRDVLVSAERFTANDAFAAQHRLLRLRRQVQSQFATMDILAVPTAPRPFTFSEMAENPIVLNNQLGYYSYFANLLDLCGLAIPNGTLANGMPMGITLLAAAWHDMALLDFAERLLPDQRGAMFGLKAYATTSREASAAH